MDFTISSLCTLILMRTPLGNWKSFYSRLTYNYFDSIVEAWIPRMEVSRLTSMISIGEKWKFGRADLFVCFRGTKNEQFLLPICDKGLFSISSLLWFHSNTRWRFCRTSAEIRSIANQNHCSAKWAFERKIHSPLSVIGAPIFFLLNLTCGWRLKNTGSCTRITLEITNVTRCTNQWD